MPTRTEIVITFGEVLDCLPPGKSYNRKRYNSFDANIGPVEGNEENQENLAPASGAQPPQPCRDMRPEHQVAEEPEPVLSLRARRATNSLNCDETDDEISFRDIKLNGDSPDDGKNKSKRKSNAERFLEDNANYFQLEVLTSKTRSNKLLGGDEGDSDEGDGKGGFHTSFLDFLKSKGVEKEASGRSRHKSADSDVGERPASRATHGRSRSSHSRFGRSKSSARSANGRERSLSRGRSRLLSGVDGSEVFMSESESECSVKLARLEVDRRASARSVSPAESSETSGRGRRGRSRGRDATSESEAELSLSKGKRSKSSLRDTSPSGSEAEILVRPRRCKSAVRDVSVTESEYETPPQTPVSSRRGKSPSMDLSLSESEHEAPTTRSRREKSPVRDASPSESEHEVTASRSRRGKTSERDLSPGSEADAPAVRSKRGKSLDLSLSESEAEVPTTRIRPGKSRDVSPSESEAEAPTTRSRRGKSHDRDVSLSESEAEAPTTRSRLGKSRDVSPSESEASLPTSRTRKGKSPPKDEASESEVETPVRTRRSKSSAREPRDISLSESEPDIQPRARNSRSSARDVSPTESEAELPVRTRRGARREVSPSGSEASLASSTKHDKTGAKESDAESDEEQSKPGKNVKKKGKETPQKNKNKKKRSELDKLLEAVDTSFHFETAAAERKRMNDSGLGPLEIDCSDTGSEASCNISNKRKFSEMEIGSNKKKCKESNNLLKTASPGSALKSEDLSGDELESVTGPAWDGWDALNSQLELISDDPVEISKMHFSFESVPMKESWYSTYQRQDRGDELVFYPTSTTAPFLLPYEMPYNTFQSSKPGRRDTDTSRDQSKASSPVRQLGSLNKKGRKISECESTDSEEARRGKGRTSKASSTTSSTTLDKLGPKGALLLDTNYRVSPRCHASTKSLVTGGLPGDLDDLAEAYLMQDERELHFPNFLPMLQSEENSNDSFSSGSVNSRVKSESSIEMSKLAASLDTLMQNPEELPCNLLSPSTPAKVPPTRSRVSSDQLLSPKKAKKKKKLSAETDQAGVSPLDQLVADNVDPVLLDCLEDELPTVSCPSLEDPMDMLDTYSTCTSMSVCNSRWLKPNKRDSLLSSQQKEPKLENKPKKLPSPSKPKRIIIYKDDLPGFSIDSDMEAEKLPVSKRGKAKAQTDNDKQEEEEEEKKVKSPPKKDSKKATLKKNDKNEDFKKTPEKKSAVSKEIDDMLQSDDDDSESVESFNSTSSGSKKRRRTNKTGFPSPKKKKKADSTKNSPSEKSPSANQTKPIKSKTEQKQVFNKSSAKSEKPRAEKPKPNSEKTKQSSDEPKPTPKKTVSKQLKMDRFITAKSTKKTPASDKSKTSSSPVVPLVAGRRSVALKAKNYSELESDTESLFESPLALSSSPSPAPGQKKAKSGSVLSKGVKKR